MALLGNNIIYRGSCFLLRGSNLGTIGLTTQPGKEGGSHYLQIKHRRLSVLHRAVRHHIQKKSCVVGRLAAMGFSEGMGNLLLTKRTIGFGEHWEGGNGFSCEKSQGSRGKRDGTQARSTIFFIDR